MALRSFSPAASARSVHPSLTAASLLPSRTGSIRAPGFPLHSLSLILQGSL
ncbi:hypothetical protein B296_00046078 [Ensete ventricosum]|uniref:Uncharacterized protein n=1 Tax=Ensete ventricosum TaxID=4639 RepID=A0A426Z3M5_ENSVE|nr:hypothetical protein B296_00046078 [Ensete ventricosum]